MNLFHIFRRRTDKSRWIGFYMPPNRVQDYANSDIMGIFRMITSRLEHFEFQAAIDFLTTQEIIKFIKNNMLQIIQRLFYDGFLIIDCKNYSFVNLQFKSMDFITDRMNIQLAANQILYVDEIFKTNGQPMRQILYPYITFLNTINNADSNLIENYGAMGILSPESDTHETGHFDEEDKKELQEDYNRLHGITRGKWSVMITRRPIKFQELRLPISALELKEKRKSAVAEILQFLNIPKELHALFENSKYANRNEAELDMYTNCCGAWADVILKIIRRIYENKKEGEEYYLLNNDFWYDITGVPAIAEKQEAEKQRAREELQFWKEASVSFPSEKEYIDTRIKDLINNM